MPFGALRFRCGGVDLRASCSFRGISVVMLSADGHVDEVRKQRNP